ncbi:MAG: TonB family protein, partial [Acidobacteriota bacterium]
PPRAASTAPPSAPPREEPKPTPAEPPKPPAPVPPAPPKETAKPAPAEPAKAAPPPEPQKEAPKPPAQEGVAFGNYILMDKIAVGGMAELFKARQNGLEGFKRIVAIKRILPHLAANQEFVTMFTDEAKLAAQLNHPNIGHIYDLGKLEDSYFIAMEYVDGRDLRTILKELDNHQARMPYRVAVFIAQRVCAALHYAHTAKDVDGKPMDLVHRDVSPQNIIISTTGEAKLVDFGIAKAASKASHTQSGALKGKLLYMSPEQAWGKTINHQADIFALGVVMWEMLTGRKLFYGDSEMSILEKVREAKVEPPQKYREDLPEELERIVLKALGKTTEERYPSCQAMMADLERFAYDEWETLPSAYDAAAFLNGFFPDVYKREILDNLKKEPEAQEGKSARGGKIPKSQRGRPAPLKKDKAPAPEPPPAPVKAEEPPKAVPAPKAVPSEPKPAPAPAEPKPAPAAPPTPAKSLDETTGSRMFGDVVEKPSGGMNKNLLIGGGVAAAILVVVVGFFALRGKKPAAPPVPEPTGSPAAAAQPGPSGASPATQPAAPPPVVATPVPATPAAGAPPATEAEIAAARRSATGAVNAFNKAVSDLEQAGAGQYVADSLASLKQSQQNIQNLMRRAKTPEEFKAAEDGARQAVTLAGQVKTQFEQAKAAADQEAARKAAEAEAARKAQEEAARKAQEEEAERAAQAGKIKAGDFVDLWAVDVKPRETKKVPVAYTPMARQNKVQGTVYVEVSISETGDVTAAKVVRGLTPDYGLNDACVQAALQTKYSPAIKDGVPVKTTLTYPVVFKIQSP